MLHRITLCILIVGLLAGIQYPVGAQTAKGLSFEKIAEISLPRYVSDARWSPDGTRLAIVNYPSILIWILKSQELTVLVPDAQLSTIAWSPDSRKLATITGGEDETLRIWDAATGQLLVKRALPEPGDAYSYRLSWSPDGKRIASDSTGVDVLIWPLFGNEMIFELKGHKGRIGELDWSPDAKRVAASSGDGTIRIWDASTGRNLVVIQGGGYSVDWNPKDDRVVSADGENACIWDARSGKELLCMKQTSSTIVRWNFEGDLIATGGLDGFVKVWEAQSGKLLATVHRDGTSITALSWHPYQNLLVSGGEGENIKVWRFRKTGGDR